MSNFTPDKLKYILGEERCEGSVGRNKMGEDQRAQINHTIKNTRNLREKLKLRKTTEPYTNPLSSKRLQEKKKREPHNHSVFYNDIHSPLLFLTLMTTHLFL